MVRRARSILDREALAGRVDGLTVVAPVELVESFALRTVHPPRGAVSVARTAAARLADDPRGDDVRTVEPIYLRAPRGVATEADGEVRWL